MTTFGWRRTDDLPHSRQARRKPMPPDATASVGPFRSESIELPNIAADGALQSKGVMRRVPLWAVKCILRSQLYVAYGADSGTSRGPL